MARRSEVERQARALCVELARVTGGRVMQWRTVEPIATGAGLDDAAASEAIAFAVERDWLLTEGSRRIASASRMAGASWPPSRNAARVEPMPKQRRYSIEIKDDMGKTVIFTAADWTDDERARPWPRSCGSRGCPIRVASLSRPRRSADLARQAFRRSQSWACS